MKNQAVLLALLFVSFVASGQETGIIIFQVKPPIGTTLAKLGDSIFQAPKAVIPVGTYQLMLWAPYYEAVIKTVTVSANETVTVKDRLVLNQDVQDYLQKILDNKRVILRRQVLPYAGTGLFLAGSTVAWIRARRFQQEAFDWKHRYERVSSTGSIDDSQRRFAVAKKKSRNAKVTLATLGGLSVVGCYYSWQGHKKVQTLEKPVRPQPVRPLELTGISTDFSSFGLTFNF